MVKSQPIRFAAGDRVRKRGFPHVGTVLQVQNDPAKADWVKVQWPSSAPPRERPTYCSHHELEAAP